MHATATRSTTGAHAPTTVLLDTRPARGKHRARRDTADVLHGLLARCRRGLYVAAFTAATILAAIAATPTAAYAAPVVDEPAVDYGVLDDPCSYAACDGRGWRLPSWVPFGGLVSYVVEVPL